MAKIAVTWRSTARSDRYTVLAIARLLRPSAISWRTSRSRSVSASRRERRPTTCATTAGSSTEPPAATSRTAEMKRATSGLDQVPDARRAGVEQRQRRVLVLGEHEHAGAVQVLAARRLRERQHDDVGAVRAHLADGVRGVVGLRDHGQAGIDQQAREAGAQEHRIGGDEDVHIRSDV